ncbi:MAG: RluA family pseudouridine synthase [Opitutae bacterium]|nr:RluA family pseudouridine synthase [Opitutae bacterium]
MPLPPILHEDDALLAFDKPSGLAVAPDARDRARENVKELVQAARGAGLANVHRLDDETSGVLLYTKTKPALDFVSGQFQAKTAGKIYHALVVGRPEEDAFAVDLVLKEDEAARGQMCVVKKHGLASRTEFKVLERFALPAGRESFAWIECRPATGRMHQIRVHLAASALPVLGDPLYGDGTELRLSDLKRGYKGREDERPLIGRLALHAHELTFVHPTTREPITIAAPLANDFAVALKYLRKFAGGRAR